MSEKLNITRRDFINGIALGVAASRAYLDSAVDEAHRAVRE